MTRRLARLRRFLARRREDLHREQLADRVVEAVGENARRRAEQEPEPTAADSIHAVLSGAVRDLGVARELLDTGDPRAARVALGVARDRILAARDSIGYVAREGHR